MLSLPAALLVSALPAGAAAPPPPIVPADAGEVLSAVREAGARAVLVNVWATWCLPCREELPDILRLRRELAARGLAVILVSTDFDDAKDAAVQFLAAQGVDFPSFLKTGGDVEFIDRLSPEWSGALPASFVFDGAGKLRHFREGKLTYKVFRELVLDVLEQKELP